MASPIGHALVGLLLARRAGVRSNVGQAAAVVAAGLPDVDVPAGYVLHGNAWKLHKKNTGTHTFAFALTSGMIAGFAGLIRGAATDAGDRDLVADALYGAALVGSHIVLDRAPLPYLKFEKDGPRREIILKSVFNWSLDAAVYGFIARRFWPAAETEAPGDRPASV